MSVELRAITEDEFEEFHRVEGTAFGHVDLSSEALAADRAVTDLDRTIGAFDGTDLVATAAAYTMDMTLPGGAAVPVGGVTAVSVLTTHRRQGILRSMMAHQLDDIAGRGESMAILNASESGIYGRFGYGLAQLFQSWRLDTARVHFQHLPDPGLHLRIVPQQEAIEPVRAIYERWRPTRPGAVTMSAAWFASVLGERETWRGGGKRFVVTCESDDPADGRGGFVIYRIEHQDGLPGSWRLHVQDMVATDAGVSARLWRFLCDVDLVGTVLAPVVPLDDPLRWFVTDPRQVQVTGVRDFVFVRILDVAAALSARAYVVDDSLTLDVHDGFRPQTDGRYQLVSKGGEVACTRVPDDSPADLTVGIKELGSLLLGGVRATDLAAAGGIVERTAGAVARADALFGWPVAPFCITRF